MPDTQFAQGECKSSLQQQVKVAVLFPSEWHLPSAACPGLFCLCYSPALPVAVQAAASGLRCPGLEAAAQVAAQAAAALAEALAPPALHDLQELRSLLQVGCQGCRNMHSAPPLQFVQRCAWQCASPVSLQAS